jgi:hypothetical protein
MEGCAPEVLAISATLLDRAGGRSVTICTQYRVRAEVRAMARHRLASRYWWFGGLGLLTAAMGASCSATGGLNIFTGGEGGSGAGISNGNGSGAGSGTDSSGAFMFSDAGPSDANMSFDGAGCAGEATKAQQLPLDMYVMLDQSGSMTDTVSGGGDKWAAITKALKQFVMQPGLAGIGMGLQYFPLDSSGGASCTGLFCTVNSDCGPAACGGCDTLSGICNSFFGGDSCNPTDYATPDVEIAALPGVSTLIINSLNQHMPTNSTPTQGALQGAINHAKAWAAGHPGHVVIAVLATDGQPTECTIQDAAGLAAIAAAGKNGTPSVDTFTIGIFTPSDIPAGPNLLDQISQAGGTGSTFTVDTGNPNTAQQFLDALNIIRGTALGCNYKIPLPDAGTPDFTKVNVQYTPGGGGSPEIIGQVANKAACPSSGDAWYYDNPTKPTQIVLCDATCNKLSMDNQGEVDVITGCKTVIK